MLPSIYLISLLVSMPHCWNLWQILLPHPPWIRWPDCLQFPFPPGLSLKGLTHVLPGWLERIWAGGMIMGCSRWHPRLPISFTCGFHSVLLCCLCVYSFCLWIWFWLPGQIFLSGFVLLNPVFGLSLLINSGHGSTWVSCVFTITACTTQDCHWDEKECYCSLYVAHNQN